MQKMTEAWTTSIQVYPTATTGKSGSSLLDMSQHERLLVKLMGHRLVDDKGAGVITVTTYESDVSTWSASATAITAGVATATLNSASDSFAQVSLLAKDLSINASSGKRYVGVYVAANTSTVCSIMVERAEGSYNPQQ
jgi:hypothetical protein